MAPDASLQDYGVDSVLVATLMRTVRQKLKTDLDPSAIYEFRTLRGFADWLVTRHSASLRGLLAPAANIPAEEADRGSSCERPGRDAAKVNRERTITRSADEPIAVVGLSCRFAGAPDLARYWKMLEDGCSSVGPVPSARWGGAQGNVAGLLEDVDLFDPAYFQIPIAEAKSMDPQALLVLEESLKLWCNAGYTREEIRGSRVGVYLGARSTHYPAGEDLAALANPILAVGQNYLATNVSRFFDLVGPSLVIDTACSSALVAMHLAIQGLLSGEISAAMVGGVNVLDSDAPLKLFAQRGLLSRAGEFHIFDRRASGAVLGEGVGLVVLKRLSQAIADDDQVYAVVKGIAVNNDGRTAGPNAPNFEGQKAVMEMALAKSGVIGAEISHVEANGSGSEITDLLELKAIEAVYRRDTQARCSLGSVKPNIGHPLCAEGIASFIKVALMLHHKRWVPFLSGHQPLAHYDIEASPFYFRRSADDWTEQSRLASVNSFADGGTNAHVILQSWEDRPERQILRQPVSLPHLQRISIKKDAPKVTVAHSSPVPPARRKQRQSPELAFWR